MFANWEPGILLSALHVFTHFILTNHLELSITIILTLKIRKLRHKVVNLLIMEFKRQNQNIEKLLNRTSSRNRLPKSNFY